MSTKFNDWETDEQFLAAEAEQKKKDEQLIRWLNASREYRHETFEPKLRHLLIAGGLVLLAGWWVFHKVAEAINQ